MPGAPRTSFLRTRSAGAIAVTALLVIHYSFALFATRTMSPTFDETAHITAGYTFWHFDDYRLQPENGNLPQRLAALPLVLFGPYAFPSRDQAAWRESDVWAVGDQFLHRLGNDLESMLWRSRAAMALSSAALCLAVFLWARQLYGSGGGFLALLLCAFSPIVLANGPLATSDTCATLFFLLTLRSLWALLQRITPLNLLVCAGFLSALALSKASAVLILPLATLMFPAALLRNRELHVALPGRTPLTILPKSWRLAAMLGAFLVCLVVSWGAVWGAFGFRFTPAPPQDQARFQQYLGPGLLSPTLEGAAALAGTPGKFIAFAGRHRLLPEAFLYGTSYVFASLQRYSFLNGEYSTAGWRLFFPYCFLVKSTLPLLALLATALIVAALELLRPAREMSTFHAGRAPGQWIPDSAPLWILLAVFVPALVSSTINLGARHMLPVYPALFILLGGLARQRAAPALLRWWVMLLLCWHVAEGLRGYPHYLAYFNQITGRRNAYRHLVDSSLDWGQDLPGLKAWLDRRLADAPGTRVYISYFGTGSPRYYGISPLVGGLLSDFGQGDQTYRGIMGEPLEFEARAQAGLPATPEPGIYCISATNLQAVYSPVHGQWNSRYETAYRELSDAGGNPGGVSAGSLAWMNETFGPAAPEVHLLRLGTARLLAFLREREPDDEIGFSILCYDLARDDLRRALLGPPPGMGAPGSPGG